MRIVSLVPSLTELVCDLGLQSWVAGCTGFCTHPVGLHRTAENIGGTKDPSLEKINNLSPDRILVNTEENRPQDIAALRKLAPVLETFPSGPQDVPFMIRDVGNFLGAEDRAQVMAEETATMVEKLRIMAETGAVTGKKFVYFIWIRPWMAVGRDTYISRMLELAGWNNVLSGKERYPEVRPGELRKLAPEVCFFSTEPWPFRLRDLQAFRKEWDDPVPECLKIDGRLMSWYGSGTLKCARQWERWLEGKPVSFIRKFGK